MITVIDIISYFFLLSRLFQTFSANAEEYGAVPFYLCPDGIAGDFVYLKIHGNRNIIHISATLAGKVIMLSHISVKSVTSAIGRNLDNLSQRFQKGQISIHGSETQFRKICLEVGVELLCRGVVVA